MHPFDFRSVYVVAAVNQLWAKTATLKAFIGRAPSAVPEGCYAIARDEAENVLGKLPGPGG